MNFFYSPSDENANSPCSLSQFVLNSKVISRVPNKYPKLTTPENTIPYDNALCHPKILHKHCLRFLLGVKMAPRETKNNAYAKFWDDKQRVWWYVMVFSGVVNCCFLILIPQFMAPKASTHSPCSLDNARQMWDAS